MGYIGRNLANLSDRVVLDSITTSSTDTFTLQLNSVNFVPSSAESLTVSLNGVIQAPNSSYTVSSSTITFASALTSSDSIDFIIAERGITLQTPSAGSVGTSQLASTAVTTAKIADDAVTKDKVSNLMYPAFEAYISGSDQAITDATTTKAEFNTEILDTDNCYDNTTNYRFTPTVAGKYYVYSSVNSDANGSSDLRRTRISIYKNGSSFRQNQFLQETYRARQQNPYVAAIMDMNGTTDYLEIFVYVDDNSGNPELKGGSAKQSYFGAYRIGD